MITPTRLLWIDYFLTDAGGSAHNRLLRTLLIHLFVENVPNYAEH